MSDIDAYPYIVVSLATHRPRFDKLVRTLPFILKQSLAFDVLLINVQDDLSVSDFDRFKSLESEDHRIKVVKRTAKWRSFNKFIHAVREYPDSHIITCDDDIRYPEWMFEDLYKAHLDDKDAIIAHELNPVDLVPTSEGGMAVENLMTADVKLRQRCFSKYLTGCAFFPKGIFTKESLEAMSDYESFYDITHATHDELWMWIHSTIQGIQVIGLDSTYTFDLDGAFPPDDSSLCRINGRIDEVKAYDERINNDVRYGPSLFEKLHDAHVVFKVDSRNLLAVCGQMKRIHMLYSGYKIVFDCRGDRRFLPSMLNVLVGSVTAFPWRRSVEFFTVIAGNFGNGVED